MITKTKRRKDRKNKSREKTTEIPSSAFAQRLAPDTSTLPTTPQPPPHAGQMGRGQGNTKSDGEDRARGFSPRAALAAGCKGEKEREGESRDWLAGSYGGSYGSRTSRGRRGVPPISRRPFPPLPLLPSLQWGYFPRLPRGESREAHAHGPRFRLASWFFVIKTFVLPSSAARISRATRVSPPLLSSRPYLCVYTRRTDVDEAWIWDVWIRARGGNQEGTRIEGRVTRQAEKVDRMLRGVANS